MSVMKEIRHSNPFLKFFEKFTRLFKPYRRCRGADGLLFRATASFHAARQQPGQGIENSGQITPEADFKKTEEERTEPTLVD